MKRKIPMGILMPLIPKPTTCHFFETNAEPKSIRLVCRSSLSHAGLLRKLLTIGTSVTSNSYTSNICFV